MTLFPKTKPEMQVNLVLMGRSSLEEMFTLGLSEDISGQMPLNVPEAVLTQGDTADLTVAVTCKPLFSGGRLPLLGWMVRSTWGKFSESFKAENRIPFCCCNMFFLQPAI